MRPLLEKELARLEEQKRRLVEAYVYEQAIDQETYRKELARIGEELSLVRVEHNANAVDSLDVEAVLEFAEYVVLNARRLWQEFPLDVPATDAERSCSPKASFGPARRFEPR